MTCSYLSPLSTLGSRLPGVYARPGRHHHADEEAAGPAPHARAENGESAHGAPSRAHRARQQPRQVLPQRPRYLPPAEGGHPRSADGNLLCVG
jgi:hypothetical protein